MIAPDLFKIKPPREHVQYSTSTANAPVVNNMINNHFFNHSVNVIFPDTLHAPAELKEYITVDTEYYQLDSCPLYLFVEYPFIEAFVIKGKVTLLSSDSYLDTDSCCSLTPSGYLILSLHRNTFLQLGIEKGPAVNVIKFKNNTRYLVTINLRDPSFKPDKNNYKRVLQRLLLSKISMDVIVDWEPGDVKVCPSSIASYFVKRGVACEECSPQFREERFYSVNVPNFQASADELFEWLGLFLLRATDKRSSEETEYLSCYHDPEDSETVGQVLVFQQTGLLTSTRISSLWKSIREYISNRTSIPWIGLHVHGFEDSPVTWNLEPHSHSVFGDNNYTLVCDQSESVKMCKVFTSLRCRD